MSTTRVLTGITTTGTPHLGNYVGAIRPAIAASRRDGVESFFFLADYHALIKCDDPARIERSRMELAATWLAAGLDPERVTFYRQSDIPEIPELTWLLTCVTAKGQMNRAHAYKAAADANAAAGEDTDAGVTMGLYCYPILMAADILMFNAHQVPVGRDQIQHIEMARDVAQRFNHLFGAASGREFFVLPEAVIEEQVAVLPGLDGRKMSKSYNNSLLLAEDRESLAKKMMTMKTDTARVRRNDPGNPDNCPVFSYYDFFAPDLKAEVNTNCRSAALGCVDCKKQLLQRVDAKLEPFREKRAELKEKSNLIADILHAGADKARTVAHGTMSRVKDSMGMTTEYNL